MNIKNMALSALGCIFLLMGSIGIFLPVWPTTPFILLAVACFSSSPKMKAYIMKVDLFREHVDNYGNRNGLSKVTVLKSLSFLWFSMAVSIVFIQKLWLVALLAFIGAAVTVHILYMAKPRAKKCIRKHLATPVATECQRCRKR